MPIYIVEVPGLVGKGQLPEHEVAQRVDGGIGRKLMPGSAARSPLRDEWEGKINGSWAEDRA